MKPIYSAANPLLVHHLANLLEAEGIACQVKGQYLTGGAGELPPTETWPELFLEHEQDEERAQRVIDNALSNQPSTRPRWCCPECGEKMEGQFDQCWRCGTLRTEDS